MFLDGSFSACFYTNCTSFAGTSGDPSDILVGAHCFVSVRDSAHFRAKRSLKEVKSVLTDPAQNVLSVKDPVSMKQLSPLSLRAWYGPYLPPPCWGGTILDPYHKALCSFPTHATLNGQHTFECTYNADVTMNCYLLTELQSSPLKHRKAWSRAQPASGPANHDQFGYIYIILQSTDFNGQGWVSWRERAWGVWVPLLTSASV